jgi:hypothetical protein
VTSQTTAVVAAWLALVMPISIATSQSTRGARSMAPATIIGRWRIVRSTVAPWVMQAKIVNTHRDWIGRTITFEPHRVVGPGVLDCGQASYTPTSVPAEGLFQGSLLAPAKEAAAKLGLVAMPVRGTSLRCDAGVFELHRADAATLLVALDKVIYTLDRSPGAFAPDTSPAGVVQRLLEHHFVGSMAFDSAHIAYHAPWLSARLRSRLAAYFAKPSVPAEVPVIDGDPFTDSQEHPTRFSVSLGSVRGGVAVVPVRFSDGRRVRSVQYLLRREIGGWRVDDLRYESGESFGRQLR